ncbi:MAG: amidohydrolase 2 [Actinomycetia bacterium]|nr:amidohydrolase 2 [Actinomycetes bacterium]
MPTTSPDAPLATTMALSSHNAAGSLCDWVFSGSLSRFPTLKIAFAESQIGWMPYQLERMDIVAAGSDAGGVKLDRPPSEIVHGRVWGCVFDDMHGLKSRDAVGLQHILFETDYPHTDGTWPDSRAVAHRLCHEAGMDAEECRMFLRQNAIDCYGLERFGISR